MTKIRTRFAPSPTGRMHVGNLRTALYAYLVAKHEGGDFILRIEDTDQERYVEGAVDIIYRTMEKTGLVHDEGPDKDGGVGPYVQSERQASGIYLEYAKQLIAKGEAYYCFCDKERLATLNRVVAGKEINVYDKHCLHLSKEEVEAKLAAGVPYVIRQNNPTEGTTTFHDEIYGDITVDNSELDDMILIKSDGYPTYNFANVVDDHLMGITHVVRGNEYLSSSPKYNRLYDAFGWKVPVYIHCPLITDEEHHKLSKRCGHSSYEDLIAIGYLSEAVVNYVTLLGWSPRGEYAEREFFTLAELAEIFDIGGISKSPAIFDIEKLTYFNAHYLREMSPEAFHAAALPYIRQAVQNPALSTEEIAGLLQARCERLTDIPEKLDFFDALPDYDAGLFTNKKSKTNPEVSRRMLEAVLPALEGLADWTVDGIHDALIGLAESLEVKNATLMWPVRIAAAGKAGTPGGAVEICHTLGKDECLRRLRLGLDKLGG